MEKKSKESETEISWQTTVSCWNMTINQEREVSKKNSKKLTATEKNEWK